MFSGRRGNLPQIATNPMCSRNDFIHKGLFLESLNLGNNKLLLKASKLNIKISL